MKREWLQLFGEGEAPAEGGAGGLVEQQAENAQPEARQEDSRTQEHWQRVERIYGIWLEQAEELKQLFPGFDLRRELEDGRFAGMLLTGVDMASAYQALHAGQILPAAMEYAARTVGERIAASLGSGALRPGENGLGGGATALVGRNITNMTRQDYAKVCRMVERGERVSFG